MTDFTKLTPLHKSKYGGWGGNRDGFKPDPYRCCQEVHSPDRFALFYQCSRKRGYGPEGAYCKQHDPAFVAEKNRAAQAKYKEQRMRERPKWYAHKMLAALKEIASGHNDPRSLAKSLVEQIEAES